MNAAWFVFAVLGIVSRLVPVWGRASAATPPVTHGPTPRRRTCVVGLAEFERALIKPRTGEGRGRPNMRPNTGRPFKLTHHQKKEALARRDKGELLSEIAGSFNVHPSKISRLT
jgi:hypothetical protein